MDTEIYTEFSVGTSIILLRLVVRIAIGGFRRLSSDDYFMMAALATYIPSMITITRGDKLGSIAGLTQERLEKMTPDEIYDMRVGSILHFFAWLAGFTTIWLLKGSMLAAYTHLGFDGWQKKLLIANIWFCLLSYVGIILAVGLNCYPVQLYWQVSPIPPMRCTTVLIRQLPIGIGNLISDVCLLALAIPLIIKVQLPLRKKIILAGLLSGGVFVIIITILRLTFVLQKNKNVNMAAIWSFREMLVAIFVVNTPPLRPLFSYVRLWPTAGRSGTEERSTTLRTIGSGGGALKQFARKKRSFTDSEILRREDSQERILSKNGSNGSIPLQNVTPAVSHDDGAQEPPEEGRGGEVKEMRIYISEESLGSDPLYASARAPAPPDVDRIEKTPEERINQIV